MPWLIVFTLSQLLTQALAIDRYYGDDDAQLTCTRPMGVLINVEPAWSLNGRELDLTMSRKYSVSNFGETLTISDIGYLDEGNYTCQFRQNNEVFSSSADILRVVGRPVFSSCNRTRCGNEEICTAIHGIEVALDLQINFINSVSMTKGPSPHRIEVSKEVDRNQLSVLSCSMTACVAPETGFSWRGMPPNNLSLLITRVSQEFSGTYTATATVKKPSSEVDVLLSKVFIVSARDCGSPPSAPFNGNWSMDGCDVSYSYSCDGGRDIRVTRQCLESNTWSGNDLMCDQMPVTLSTTPKSTMDTFNSATTSSTTTMQETLNMVSLIATSIAVPLVAVALAVTLLIVIAVAVMLAWQRGHKQGSREVYAPSSREIIQNQYREQHRIVVSHNLHEVKEGWRSSLNIEQQIELPVQKGVPNVEVAV